MMPQAMFPEIKEIYFWHDEQGWWYGDPDVAQWGPWHSFETLLYRWETKQPDLRIVA